MGIAVKIDPIDRELAVMLGEALDPKARSQALATFAREQLADAQTINRRATGAVPPHETFVDGRKDAAIETVKPDGTIVFEFDLIRDTLTWIGEQLVKHSPVLTGAYARSHALLADGREVTPGEPIPEAAEYVFVSTVPYARKIERGLSRQAPEGVYEVVADLAHRRLSNIADIRFSYRSPLLSYVAGGANRAQRAEFKKNRARTAAQSIERATRVPAVIVRVR